MNAVKVQVKIFCSGQPDVYGCILEFQRWIREQVLSELLIDVVDYSHVADGPEVALIGHESDYVLDRAGGKLGLLYCNKRMPNPENGSFLGAVRRALTACQLLEKAPGLNVPLTFRADEILVRIADRLNAPNTDETFLRIEPALQSVLTLLYGPVPFTLKRIGSSRELFAVQVQAPTAPPLCELQSRLGGD